MCFSRHCYQGTCKATSEGESCDTAADCEGQDRYFCSPSSHTCIRRDRPDGEHCELNEQCVSGLCSNGACKKPDGSSGAVCQKNSDCKAPLVCVRDELTEKLNNEPGRKSCMSPDLPWVNPSSSGCTAPGLLCTSNNACCSKNCKWTVLLGVRECAWLLLVSIVQAHMAPAWVDKMFIMLTLYLLSTYGDSSVTLPSRVCQLTTNLVNP